MTGQIPSYGKNFRLEHVPYEASLGLASRRYVLKADSNIFIRSTSDSKSWQIFVAGPADAAFPIGDPRGTLTEAMKRAVAMGDLLK